MSDCKKIVMKYVFKNLDFIGRFLKTKVQNSLQWQVFSPAVTAMDKPDVNMSSLVF